MSNAGWVLYTCRSPFAAEAAEIVWRRGERVVGLVDNLPDPVLESTLGPVAVPAQVPDGWRGASVALALVTPGHRYVIEAEARSRGFDRFTPLVDPTAVVARTATLADGTIVNAAAVVGTHTVLGRFVHVNRSASLGHDLVVEDFATLGPGSVLTGKVQVGRGAFIGAGATIAPNVRIGANAIVGIGSVVVEDVAPNTTVLGNPARVIARDVPGYGRVGVPGT